MSKHSDTVLTIGHSTHPLEAFVALLKRHDVTAVADVRSAPWSRFNPQFNREPLAGVLEEQGIRYVFLGRELGGRSDDPACHENGRISYARLARTDGFSRGLHRIMHGMSRFRIALMCAEREPLECHRTLLVARALDAQGVDVTHIHADGALEPHTGAMARLLDVLKLPRQDLYRTRDALIDAAVARQEERVAHVNEKLAVQATEQDG